jgi:hypothetical protein
MRVMAATISFLSAISLGGAAVAREISVQAPSASLAYAVASHSPLLSAAQRRAISQDFHGAPLSRAPRVHSVVAESISCREPQRSVGGQTRCTINYTSARTVQLTGANARSLFRELGIVGAETEGGMMHLERTITKLTCTVDDKIAQETPSSGNAVAGFSCDFSVE